MREKARFFFRRPDRYRCLVALVIALWVLAGCQDRPGSSSVAPTPTGIASPTPGSGAQQVEPTPTPSHIELTVWAPPALSPQSREGGADLLTQQIAVFEVANPSISIRYEPKAEDGDSSLLQFLRTASAVAPRVLPDVVILPSDDFNDAARVGLLYPLDTLVADELLQALYPFAQRDGRVGENLLALPMFVTVEHVIYRPRGAQPPPATWEAFLNGQQHFLFAAAGRPDGVNNPFLLQLLNISGKPLVGAEVPDMQALGRVLEFYDQGRTRNLIPAGVVELDESQQLWLQFLAGGAELLETDARSFLIERTRATELAYAAVPTSNGVPTTVAEGYLVAVTTADPLRQEAAMSYINWLLASEQLGPYAAATRWLPARPDALSGAIADASYRQFLDTLLASAWLRPSGSRWTAISRAVQEQFSAVLNDQRTPAEAIQILQETLRP